VWVAVKIKKWGGSDENKSSSDSDWCRVRNWIGNSCKMRMRCGGRACVAMWCYV
jgi:hypothetical protein